MKQVIAVIRRERWNATQAALYELGVTEHTQFSVQGRGQQRGLRHSAGSGASPADLTFLPKRMVICLVEDAIVPQLIRSIIRINQTGNPGDGKLFVSPIELCSPVGAAIKEPVASLVQHHGDVDLLASRTTYPGVDGEGHAEEHMGRLNVPVESSNARSNVSPTRRPSMGVHLRVGDVTKSFPQKDGSYTAVTDVSLEVAPGEVVAIIGHSGCGKSTLLNMIAGLDRPTSGSVELDGQPVEGPGRDRAMVFQHHGL